MYNRICSIIGYKKVNWVQIMRCVVVAMLVCAVWIPVHAQNTNYSDVASLVSQQDDQNNIVVYASNTLPIPVYFYVQITQIKNYQSAAVFPYGFVVPPQTTDYQALSFNIIDPTQKSSIQYKYRFSLGNPTEAVHNQEYEYLFPFAHGEKFEVGQSHNGTYSHDNDQNRYAVDFNMDINTPIHAAREGFVVFVKEDANIGGRGAQYGPHTNIIIIMHNDNSFSNYVHLKQDGALVEVGQKVDAGQHIGYSGNTGNSSGPHLHFDVQIPRGNGTMASIPVTFTSLFERIMAPKVGEYYYSSHPEGQPFEVILGRTLNARSFDDYIKSIEDTNALNVRSEQIDNTFIIFCSNGNSVDIAVEIDVRIVGLNSELEYPRPYIIPAQSEIFCGIFRRQKNATRIQITPRIRTTRQ